MLILIPTQGRNVGACVHQKTGHEPNSLRIGVVTHVDKHPAWLTSTALALNGDFCAAWHHPLMVEGDLSLDSSSGILNVLGPNRLGSIQAGVNHLLIRLPNSQTLQNTCRYHPSN